MNTVLSIAADRKLNAHLLAIDKQFNADDIERARQDRIDEQLQDGELTLEAVEAVTELCCKDKAAEAEFNRVMEAIAKAVILGGSYRDLPISSILANISPENERYIRKYFYKSCD